MGKGERHLDIGCGDGHFLRRSKCRERVGLVLLLGDDIGDHLDFPDDYFDHVSIRSSRSRGTWKQGSAAAEFSK